MSNMMLKIVFLLTALFTLASASFSGIATSYVRAGGSMDSTGQNMCEFSPSEIPAAFKNYFAAMPEAHWNSADCGKCIKCTGKGGTVYAMIVDMCPSAAGSAGCGAHDVDFSEEAAKACTNEGWGESPMTWDIVDCPSSPTGGPSAAELKAAADKAAADKAAADKAAADKLAQEKAAAEAKKKAEEEAARKAAEAKAAAEAAKKKAEEEAATKKKAEEEAAAKKKAEEEAAKQAAVAEASRTADPSDLEGSLKGIVAADALQALSAAGSSNTVQTQSVESQPVLTQEQQQVISQQATDALNAAAQAQQAAIEAISNTPAGTRKLTRRLRSF